GREVLGATTTAAARTAIGAAASSHTHPSTQVSDSTTVGRAVMTAASDAAARTAIGAGTSNLAIGTTGTTAMRGNAIVVNPSSIAGLPHGTLVARTSEERLRGCGLHGRRGRQPRRHPDLEL